MKTIYSAKNILILISFLIMTSCASDFQKYKQNVRFNNMQCQKMCSTGNVAQIAKFDCVCNLNKSQGYSNAVSSSNGNQVHIYNVPQNRIPSSRMDSKPQSNPWVNMLGVLYQNEQRQQNRAQGTLNNWGGGRINSGNTINRGYAPTVTPSNVFGIIGE